MAPILWGSVSRAGGSLSVWRSLIPLDCTRYSDFLGKNTSFPRLPQNHPILRRLHEVDTQHKTHRSALLFFTGFSLVSSICTRSHINLFVHFV